MTNVKNVEKITRINLGESALFSFLGVLIYDNFSYQK